MIQTCECRRATYDDKTHKTCYECFLDRRSQFWPCLYCGVWHHPRFDACYKCRKNLAVERIEAACALRQLILMRDDYQCQNCWAHEGDEQVNPFARPLFQNDGTEITLAPLFAALHVDHIKPCAHGGTADEWNLQVLCGVCNRIKGATWFPGCRWEPMRTKLCRRYFFIARSYFGDEERGRFMQDVNHYREEGAW